ncbi:MAG: hypothetical protein ACYSW7_05310 [Planctomycetota bacterium]|jgi:membrane protein implicated in regulation of membrane protease activity
MNKKQIVVMWFGIAAFVYFVFFVYYDYAGTSHLILQLLSIVLVTLALIYTLKDKQKD